MSVDSEGENVSLGLIVNVSYFFALILIFLSHLL